MHKIWDRKHFKLNFKKRKGQVTSRYCVDSDFVFSTRFKSKHLNESTYENIGQKHIKMRLKKCGANNKKWIGRKKCKLTRVSLSRAAFAELIPPPYLSKIYQELHHPMINDNSLNWTAKQTVHDIHTQELSFQKQYM